MAAAGSTMGLLLCFFLSIYKGEHDPPLMLSLLIETMKQRRPIGMVVGRVRVNPPQILGPTGTSVRVISPNGFWVRGPETYWVQFLILGSIHR